LGVFLISLLDFNRYLACFSGKLMIVVICHNFPIYFCLILQNAREKG
jgi:hypothetical protein